MGFKFGRTNGRIYCFFFLCLTKSALAINGSMIVSHIQRVGVSGLFIGMFIGVALPPTGVGPYTAVMYSL